MGYKDFINRVSEKASNFDIPLYFSDEFYDAMERASDRASENAEKFMMGDKEETVKSYLRNMALGAAIGAFGGPVGVLAGTAGGAGYTALMQGVGAGARYVSDKLPGAIESVKSWPSNVKQKIEGAKDAIVDKVTDAVNRGVDKSLDEAGQAASVVEGAANKAAGGLASAYDSAVDRFARKTAYTGGRLAAGVIGAADDIWDYTAGGVYELLGKDEKAQALFDDDLAAQYRESASKVLGEYEGKTPILEKVGDAVEQVGRATPYIAASILSTAFVPTVGTSFLIASKVAKGLGYAALGLSSAGGATREAYKETGELGGKEFAYGTLKGGVETALEAATNHFIRDPLLDGAEQRQSVSDYFGSVYNNVNNNRMFGVDLSHLMGGEPKRIMKDFIQDRLPYMTSEAIEGGLSAWLDPYIKRLTYDKDAENASASDIAGAAIMDGLTAVISKEAGGAFDKGEQKQADIESGAAVAEKASDIIAEAKSSTVSDYPVTERKNEAVKKLEESLASTGGKVETDEQKELLGEVQKYTAASSMIPALEDSAMEILSYPEAIAEKFSALGLKDEKGNPIEVSVDDLVEGIDLDGTEEDVIDSIRKALVNNKTLATLAAADASTKFTRPNAERDLWSQYIDGASEGQMAELSETFGADPRDYTAMKRGAKNYVSTEQGKAKMREFRAIEAKAKAAQPNEKPVPNVIGTGLPDGVYRYGGDDGIAIIKENGTIHLYDYARGLISKPLTTMQVNAALARARNQK